MDASIELAYGGSWGLVLEWRDIRRVLARRICVSQGRRRGASLKEHKVYKVATCPWRAASRLFHVRYVIGDSSRPEGTKFFVFDLLADADKFIHLDPGFQ
jgi:hypothetical protein